MRRMIPIVLSLLMLQPALASDDDDLNFPPDRLGSGFYKPTPSKNAQKFLSLPWAKQDDVRKLGDEVEKELSRMLKAIDRKFEGTQESQIDCRISDDGKIMNANITTFANDPAFDYLTKKMVLSLDGTPLLKLPKRVPKLEILISATFTKSPTAASVFVRAGQSFKLMKVPSQNRLLNKMNSQSP